MEFSEKERKKWDLDPNKLWLLGCAIRALAPGCDNRTLVEAVNAVFVALGNEPVDVERYQQFF